MCCRRAASWSALASVGCRRRLRSFGGPHLRRPALRRRAHLDRFGQLRRRAAGADPTALQYADHVPRLPSRWKRRLQHWSSWPENYDEIYQRALATGYTVGHEGNSLRGRFVYFRNEGHPGTVIEMADATPTRMRIFDAIRLAAVGWDGSDPIRRQWPS